jgi:hypothetical protein
MVADDKNDCFNSGGCSFFYSILDERLTGNRQHLLGNGFGGW